MPFAKINDAMLADLVNLQTDLAAMQHEMQHVNAQHTAYFSQIPEANRNAARNLLQYLVFRSYDLRNIQDILHDLGLSSLASAESHIQAQLNLVLQRLSDALQTEANGIIVGNERNKAEIAIKERRINLLGENVDDLPAIMVTLPTEAAWETDMAENLLRSGMQIARINLAHDDAEIWEAMIDKVNLAQAKLGKSCKIYMDIPGPKIRTKGVIGPVSNKGKQKGIELMVGDFLFITSHEYEYRGQQRDGNHVQRVVPVIGCTLPELLSNAQVGDNVFFDDGKFHAMVYEKGAGYLKLKMIRVPPEKPRLKNDRGINFPDSPYHAQALTEADLDLLPFIVKRADLAGFSFVATADDVRELRRRMLSLSAHPPFVILKIERKQALENFPELLLESLHDKNFGVMIARGDLGIEVGFERLGEVQEELLWMCEAAHTPVIWATQVLDSLNKTGLATRSEISDLSLASGADCIMLNKGPHILESLVTIRDVCARMRGHYRKKRYTMRQLSIARRFIMANNHG